MCLLAVSPTFAEGVEHETSVVDLTQVVWGECNHLLVSCKLVYVKESEIAFQSIATVMIWFLGSVIGLNSDRYDFAGWPTTP